MNVICGNIMRVTPNITFEGQKHNLADERPNLYQPIIRTQTNAQTRTVILTQKVMTSCNQPWYAFPRREYVNAIVIELRDTETFSDIDPLKAVVFDNDTKDVHAHLGERLR